MVKVKLMSLSLVAKPLVEMLAKVESMSPKSMAKPLAKMLVKVKSVMLAVDGH